jgi:hypothetical protein
MSYDPKCEELAEYFLGNASERLKTELAQWIQDGVEFWLEAERDKIKESTVKPN